MAVPPPRDLRVVRPSSAVPPSGRTALPSLTGARFCAALLVFLYHTTLLSNPIAPASAQTFFGDPGQAEDLAWFFGSCGYIGVSFFFVLSGFVLTWSHRPQDTAPRFWRRRLLKIFPNHLVTWVLAMILFAGAYTPVESWLPNLFLLHSFLSDPQTFSGVNPPAWSLCCELLFYALFPLLIRPVLRIPERLLWWGAGAAVAGIVVMDLIGRYLVADTPRVPQLPLSFTQMWFSYAFPPPRMFEFVLGMVLARMALSGRLPRIRPVWVAALAVAGYAAALTVPAPFSFTLATIVPIAAIICSLTTADLSDRRTLLSSRPAVWLGEISFAFYLVQGITLFYVRERFLTGSYDLPAALLLEAVVFLLTLAAAYALHRAVEQPVMRRFAHGRPRPAPVAGPAQ
ncbi:acyltransferase family protein [Streptomyces minutiscleroticus]|uniref:acyltransferase family protein n=1 Tax=Streptomyces minutiscleroticus TaxID=68238 RepID=UPI0033225848